MAKRFVNAPSEAVSDLMQGVALNSTQVSLLDPSYGHHVAIRTSLVTNPPSDKVAVVSGGGSGHEPMAAGYVGDGMLAAAVAGAVFASPSVPAISAMLEAVAVCSKGILVIVMNYQGDRLNFSKALEDLRKRRPGYPVRLLLVGDDVALSAAQEPRGIAGSVFVLKIASAAAEQGKELEEVFTIAKTAAESIASFGVALDPCTIPGHAVDTERLGADEIELGMGIHNEPGAEKRSLSSFTISSVTDEIIQYICQRVDDALQRKHELASHCTSLAVMINNLGAVSQAEMLIVSQAVAAFLFNGNGSVLNGNRYRVHLFRDTFMTSLQMTGVSISCLMLPQDRGIMEGLLHTQTAAPGWNVGFPLKPPTERVVVVRTGPDGRVLSRSRETSPSTRLYTPGVPVPPLLPGNAGHGALPSSIGTSVPVAQLSARTVKYIMAITDALILRCDELGTLDGKTGDGDMGDTVRRGCEQLRADLERGMFAQASGNPGLLFKLLSSSVHASMGGSSGVLTAVFLEAAGQSYDVPSQVEESERWRTAFVSGTRAVMHQGKAVVGDRTLVDALKPAADALQTPGKSIVDAVRAARIGCESTKSMTQANRGRSTFVRPDMLLNQADPGALAVCYALEALLDAMLH